jgi:hypothetical protein
MKLPIPFSAGDNAAPPSIVDELPQAVVPQFSAQFRKPVQYACLTTMRLFPGLRSARHFQIGTSFLRCLLLHSAPFIKKPQFMVTLQETDFLEGDTWQ